MIKIPKGIKAYLEDESTIPLVDYNGTLWYSITLKEKELFEKFLNDAESIPESVWRTWKKKEQWKYSCMANLADRVIRNCIIR